MLQLLLSLIALILAAIFTLFFPGSGLESVIVPLVAAVAGALGLSSWRDKYDAAKEWFKSKTKFGAILTAIAVILLVFLPMFVTVPEFVHTILQIILVGGGGTSLYGIFSAIEKKTGTKL